MKTDTKTHSRKEVIDEWENGTFLGRDILEWVEDGLRAFRMSCDLVTRRLIDVAVEEDPDFEKNFPAIESRYRSLHNLVANTNKNPLYRLERDSEIEMILYTLDSVIVARQSNVEHRMADENVPEYPFGE